MTTNNASSANSRVYKAQLLNQNQNHWKRHWIVPRIMPLSMIQQLNKFVSVSKVKQSLNLNPTIQHIIGNATATLWTKEVWRKSKTGKRELQIEMMLHWYPQGKVGHIPQNMSQQACLVIRTQSSCYFLPRFHTILICALYVSKLNVVPVMTKTVFTKSKQNERGSKCTM